MTYIKLLTLRYGDGQGHDSSDSSVDSGDRSGSSGRHPGPT